MTHTSTEKPEALRLADAFADDETYVGLLMMREAATELRRLYARVQELEAKVETGKRLLREEMERANRYAEASQARVPLNKTHEYAEHKKYPGACRHCGYAENEPLQHGITQEKQG